MEISIDVSFYAEIDNPCDKELHLALSLNNPHHAAFPPLCTGRGCRTNCSVRLGKSSPRQISFSSVLSQLPTQRTISTLQSGPTYHYLCTVEWRPSHEQRPSRKTDPKQ